jgi:hypothetical protein
MLDDSTLSCYAVIAVNRACIGFTHTVLNLYTYVDGASLQQTANKDINKELEPQMHDNVKATTTIEGRCVGTSNS